MKSWWLLLILGVLACGCNDAGKDRSGERTVENSNSGAATASSNAKPTPQQLASIVRVRVAIGGFPPVDSTGALLHKDEFDGFIPASSKDRLVLAQLPNWSEDQLRSPQAQIVVLRNMSNNRGKQVATWNPARLLQFDSKSGIAVLTYLETFEAGADAGFRVDRSPSDDGSALLVSTAPYVAPGSRRLPWADPNGEPFVVASSPYQSGLTSLDAAHAGAKSAVDDQAILLAVRAPDLLTGFVAFPKNGGAQITSVEKVTISTPRFDFKPRGVSLRGSRDSGQGVKFTIVGEQTGTAGERGVWAQIVEVPSQGVDLTHETDVARLLKASLRKVRLSADADKTGEWSGSIAGVVLGEEETAYLVQPLWKLFPDSAEPSVRGTPFIVRFQRKAEGVFPSVEGLPDLSPKLSGPAQVPVRKFDLEAPVRTIHPIRGGTEVLMEFEGAPFWKRFSFAQNDWLPLPPVQLSTASLSGNLDALFVLDRGSMEVRKYSLSDLSVSGMAKLPNNVEAHKVLSGSNSDRAPVYVLSGSAVMALSPKDLQPLAIPAPRSVHLDELQRFSFSHQASYIVSGDGLSFWASEEGNSQGIYSYNDDIRGVRSRYFGLQTHHPAIGGGVSGAYGVRDWLYSVATAGGVVLNATPPANPVGNYDWASLATNCPVIFHRRLGADHATPPIPTVVECFSFFDPQPFAEVAAPELAGVSKEGAPTASSRRWITFDPSTFRLGTLAADRRQWVVRDLVRPEKRAQPVLLNWPNASIFRGEEFRFRPTLAGGSAKISAEIVGSPGMVSVNSEGEVTFRVAADQPASTLLLSLSVEGENGNKLTYPIPLHVADPPAILAAPLTVEAAQLASYANGFKFLGNVVNGVRALPTTLHRFKDPLVDVKGPVAGHLVLITETNRIDFFSLQSRRIVNSITSAPGAFYYAGGGALFEFHPGRRSFTRIKVPEGQRESTIALPAGMQLRGVAIGEHTTSPVTLLLEETVSQSSTNFGSGTLTTRRFDRKLVVLNNRTLQAGGWSQPVLLQKLLGQPEMPHLLNFGMLSESPVRFPTSHTGQIVTMPGFFLALGGGLSVTYPFGQMDTQGLAGTSSRGASTGSISGLIAAKDGTIYKGGVHLRPQQDEGWSYATPCGRYKIVLLQKWSGLPTMEVRQMESSEVLFRMGGISPMGTDRAGEPSKLASRVMMLGDNGPLALFSASGQVLQLVDCSIPALAKELNPAALHVVSQPTPCVVEGTTFQYQVQVNNPELMGACHLQGDIPGAAITPQGLLRYTAPRGISAPTKVQIAIEVTSKTGEVLVHDFPIFVLPVPKPAGMRKAGSI